MMVLTVHNAGNDGADIVSSFGFQSWVSKDCKTDRASVSITFGILFSTRSVPLAVDKKNKNKMLFS